MTWGAMSAGPYPPGEREPLRMAILRALVVAPAGPVAGAYTRPLLSST
jgi:hypothetical protein